MKASLAIAALVVLTGPALAGGPTVIADDPVPAAAPAPVAVHDWSGTYVGLSYGRTNADITFNTAGFFDFDNGSALGIYAGHLFQRGSFVYGGELAYSKVKDTFVPGFGGDDEIEYILDLKARAGFATNRALVYGVLAYSKANYVEPPAREFDMDGLGLGIGAEVAVTDRVIVGLEYMARDVSGVASDAPAITGDANVNTLGLRVGFSF